VDLRGDFLTAKQTYEKSLAIFREIGDQEGVALETNNIGVELQSLGDLHGAQKRFSDALSASTTIRDQWGEAIAEANLGEILFDLGDLAASREMYEKSLALCDRIGNKDLGAYDLSGLAQVLQAQGDSHQAWKDEKKAMSTFSEIGQLHTDVDIASARLLLEMGRTDEAVVQARKAVTTLTRAGLMNDLSDAEAVLAEALLAQGNLPESRKASAQAGANLGARSTFESKLYTEIAVGRVLAASKNPIERIEADKQLSRVINDANRAGLIPVEFEARLAHLKLVAEANLENAHSELRALEKDASARGWVSIAHKAASELAEHSRTQS
jgi:tetratricopeptide (TPR) repeat protein